MDLISRDEILKGNNSNPLIINTVNNTLFKLLKIDLLNQKYKKYKHLKGEEFFDAAFKEISINIEFDQSQLDVIPKEGAFVTVSNHPFGGIDGLILIYLISKVRPDFKVMGNYLLSRIEPIKENIIPVNPFQTKTNDVKNIGGLKNALNWLEEGHPLGVFPAGEVSNYSFEDHQVNDKKWDKTVMKMVSMTDVPVIPIYFSGSNSLSFHLLGMINPLLRTAKLPSEIFNKKNKSITVRIGELIDSETIKGFTNHKDLNRYMRTRTYMLGTSLEPKQYLKKFMYILPSAKIIDPIEAQKLELELDFIKDDLLLSVKHYEVFFTKAEHIPHVMQEIGRLREVSFREVGEGTNKSLDLDEYDFYYHQLVIWDAKEKEIVGAYRVGKGNEILETYGLNGFYLNSLFKIEKSMTGLLSESLELGRSFINPKYQKKPLSLFLLWKGIMGVLVKHPQYRYLTGSVSISGEMTSVSKNLIIEYIRKHHYNNDLAINFSPRKRFKVRQKTNIDTDVVLESIDGDIQKLDKLITEIEHQKFNFPVLLKKYLSVNAELIGFNVDPIFNNALDGLILLDVMNVPEKMVNALRKDFNQSLVQAPTKTVSKKKRRAEAYSSY